MKEEEDAYWAEKARDNKAAEDRMRQLAREEDLR